MRRRTLAVLNAAFSAVLASCAQPPPPLAPTEPTEPSAPTAAAPAPSAPTAVVAPPEPPPPTPTPVATPARDAGGFVMGEPNVRFPNQLCLGALVPSFRPGRTVDSLEMRVLQRRNERTEVVVTGRAGSPCANAKDRDACQHAFEAARPPATEEALVFTRGDEVGVLKRSEIPAFLAPIDSIEEAAAVLAYAPPDSRADGSCEPGSVTATKKGFQATQERYSSCDRDITTFAVDAAGKARRIGTKHIRGPRPCAIAVPGRRPEGLVAERTDDEANTNAIGAYLAEACRLEAASVTSFRRLERELGDLGAPASLRRRAAASARDEARHTRIMRSLARRHGAEPTTPRITPIAARSAFAIALENAVEGCVHETWAALVAQWQARHATDPAIRAAMKRLARDEIRHAALAWDTHAWLSAKLSADQRALVRTASDDAVRALHRGDDDGLDLDERAVLGLPSAAIARSLLTAWQQRSDELLSGVA